MFNVCIYLDYADIVSSATGEGYNQLDIHPFYCDGGQVVLNEVELL